MCSETRMKGPKVAKTKAPTVGTTSEATVVTRPTTRSLIEGPAAFLAAAAAWSQDMVTNGIHYLKRPR